MTDLVERYVHQVGRYLPPDERAEIEAELRSQILDQLDDRYGESASDEEAAALLLEMGYPRHIAASYNRDQYLVGPQLYPILMGVLRYGWLLIASIILFLNVFGSLISSEPPTLTSVIIDPVIAALQAVFIFSGVVVLIFALIERSGVQLDEEPFNPLTLPEVDDPHVVERLEAPIGVAVGLLIMFVLLYFLRVGGLTLRFNLSDPGEVIPVPVTWMVLLIIVIAAQVVVHLFMLGRKRWSIGMWLTQTVLEVLGTICLYFAVLDPFFDRVIAANPGLAYVPLAQIIAVVFALLTLVSKGTKLVRLWNYRSNTLTPFTVRTGGSNHAS
jgi:hypothetical protein